MKFSNAIGKLHCGAGFNTGQKQKTLSVPGRLWSMYIRAVEWNLTTGLLTVYGYILQNNTGKEYSTTIHSASNK
jgi:hypothetical protein